MTDISPQKTVESISKRKEAEILSESEDKEETKSESALIPSEGEEVSVLKETEEISSVALPASTPLLSLSPKDALTQQIETVLEEGMADLYLKMTPEEQQRFKTEGEKTAGKIRVLLGRAKVKVKQIVDLIVRWLKLIPGVNRFFLEQEAKIKTDKILRAKEESVEGK